MYEHKKKLKETKPILIVVRGIKKGVPATAATI